MCGWLSSNAEQVDAVAVPMIIRQVVTQVRTTHRDHFTALQCLDVLVHSFSVAERRPAMSNALFPEGGQGPPTRGNKERLAAHGVIKSRFNALGELIKELDRRFLQKATRFGIVFVMAANMISRVPVVACTEA